MPGHFSALRIAYRAVQRLSGALVGAELTPQFRERKRYDNMPRALCRPSLSEECGKVGRSMICQAVKSRFSWSSSLIMLSLA